MVLFLQLSLSSCVVLLLLRFSLQEPVAGGPHLDMFSGRALVEELSSEADSVKEPVTPQWHSLPTNMDYVSDLSPVRIACLLHLTRLPPRYAKLAAVRTEGKNQQFPLKPVESLLAEKDVLVETGYISTCERGVLHPSPAESHVRNHLVGKGAGHGADPDCPDCTRHYP